MGFLSGLLKASLLWFFLPFVFSDSPTQSTDGVTCPHHRGSDPSDVNARVKKLANQDIYYADDPDYKYKISICQKNSLEDTAVQQFGKKWPENKPWVVVGRYKNAHVTGGTNWLMIKYFNGDKYQHHCNGVERLAAVLVTCDPGEKRGSIKVIEEYRNSTKDDRRYNVPLECYYLFELNHDAACTDILSSSQLFITLIIVTVVEAVLLLAILLYCVIKQLWQKCHGGSRDYFQHRKEQTTTAYVLAEQDSSDDVLLVA